MTNHIKAIAAPALVELTEEEMDQVAGGAPPESAGQGGAAHTPGLGRFTAFQVDFTPINSSAPTFTGNFPRSDVLASEDRLPSLGLSTAGQVDPIQPCTQCGNP